MALTAEIIHGFSESVLRKRFDNPCVTPEFHKEMWELCCRNERQIAIAAPRGHAKSTGITLTYVLASVLFRERGYVIIVSSTESIAIEFLGNIKTEIKENQTLIDLFGINKIIKDSETELIVQFDDGKMFRIIAKGAEQKVRGRNWRGKRPDLIVVDDLEEDEQVLSQDRREKLKKWFKSALVPALSKSGIIRVVGTILHMDSLLESLMPPIGNKYTKEIGLKMISTQKRSWLSARYKAHNDDFSMILWPDMWDKESLMAKRQEYIEDGFPEGYSQEYLNYPIDETSAYFQRADFLPIRNYEEPLEYYVAADLAISEKERSDYTVIVVAGVNSAGKLKIVDVRRGRWNSLDIIDEMFSVQKRYKPEIFTLENEKIGKSLGPFLTAEMQKRGVYINLNLVTPTKDKQSRARSFNARMRSGGVEFDVDADWFPVLQNELLRFPRDAHDDQVDALSWMGLTLDKVVDARTKEEIEDDEWEESRQQEYVMEGASSWCGY